MPKTTLKELTITRVANGYILHIHQLEEDDSTAMPHPPFPRLSEEVYQTMEELGLRVLDLLGMESKP